MQHYTFFGGKTPCFPPQKNPASAAKPISVCLYKTLTLMLYNLINLPNLMGAHRSCGQSSPNKLQDKSHSILIGSTTTQSKKEQKNILLVPMALKTNSKIFFYSYLINSHQHRLSLLLQQPYWSWVNQLQVLAIIFLIGKKTLLKALWTWFMIACPSADLTRKINTGKCIVNYVEDNISFINIIF